MSAVGPAPVVFLHGRGLGPDSVDAVAPAFGNAPLLAPQGGVALHRGHTWFENERIGVARSDSVAQAEARFLQWCEKGPLRGRVAWLCGFSNGGAFAAHLLMRHPHRFLGGALLSAPLVLPPWPDGALRDQSVLYAHGDEADTVVGASFYAAAENYLTGPAEGIATIRHLPVGHAVTSEVVDELTCWFASVRTAPAKNGGTSPA